jgi:hypothetical protein
MYNNGATAIIEEMCDIKVFRFRHSLRFGVSEKHVKYIRGNFDENIVLLSISGHTNYTYRHVTRQQFSRFNYMDVIPLKLLKTHSLYTPMIDNTDVTDAHKILRWDNDPL